MLSKTKTPLLFRLKERETKYRTYKQRLTTLKIKLADGGGVAISIKPE